MSDIVLKMTKFSRWAESIFNWIRNQSDKAWTDPRRRCECALDMSMKVRKQFATVYYSMGSRDQISCQAWWQMTTHWAILAIWLQLPLPAEPSGPNNEVCFKSD